MKTSRKSLMIIVLLLFLAGGYSETYGMFQVTSNIVHVDLGYTVVLSSSVHKNTVLLTAAVSYNGNPVGAGINVDFYYSFNGGNWTYFATDRTNHNGVAQARYKTTAIGEYDFTIVIR